MKEGKIQENRMKYLHQLKKEVDVFVCVTFQTKV
jgi:hypothetical protein